MTKTTTAKTTQEQENELLEVAIIGAGPAGIIAAKTLLDHDVPPNQLLVLEETSSVGGLWNRERRPEIPCFLSTANYNNNDNPIAVPSSSQPVYRDLRTNFPKDMTSFLGYPFPAHIEMLPGPSTVAKYYQDFSSATGVDKVVQCHTRAEKCVKKGEVWQ